jgi:oligoendopeptidase F
MVRGARHTLTASEERLMALSGEVRDGYGGVFGAFHNADVSYGTMKDETGREVELTKGLYGVFQESTDRRVREESWKLYYQAYKEYGNTLAANMSGNVKGHVFNARARGYDSALEASLDPNAIPVEVYRNLISTVRENIAPLHRYVEMRRKLLSVDTLQVWDMAAPLVEQTRTDISWDAATDLVTRGLDVLGPEYLVPLREGLTSGWADVYETPGKRAGAYSWGGYATKPYLLMNYRGTLDNVFTLAHEMGHSMHSHFTRASQPFVYGDYATFVAEVASTVNEAIMIEKMLAETTDSRERLFLLNHYLEQIRGTFFTQVLFADVELQMHEMMERGEPLTRASLDRMYNETYGAYFGPTLQLSELNGAAWSRIPHFYYNFYMYQYATSYAAATALARSIMTEGDPAVQRLLAFLKSGSSDYPIEVLKRAGVDLTRPQPILDTIAVFDRLLDEMEELLAEAR